MALPSHTGPTAVNVGVTCGVIVITKVWVVAQSPAVGVNVYVVVVVLSTAGDQVPVIELLDVVGKAVKAVPAQTAGTAVNVGVTFGFTVMVIVVVVAHCPTVGVKV